jgi:hypothetical protein
MRKKVYLGRREYDYVVDETFTAKLMNKMTIRTGIMLFACVGIVTGIVFWVSDVQVTTHKSDAHKDIIERDEMRSEHNRIERRQTARYTAIMAEIKVLSNRTQ